MNNFLLVELCMNASIMVEFCMNASLLVQFCISASLLVQVCINASLLVELKALEVAFGVCRVVLFCRSKKLNDDLPLHCDKNLLPMPMITFLISSDGSTKSPVDKMRCHPSVANPDDLLFLLSF